MYYIYICVCVCVCVHKVIQFNLIINEIEKNSNF